MNFLQKIITINYLFLLLSTNTFLKAQELNCRVSIKSDLIQTSDRQVFNNLQTAINDFVNNRRWTNDVYSNHERITWNLVMTIIERPSINVYKATVQVQSERPIFGSSYTSVVLNFVDNDWDFEFVEFQTIEYSENTRTTNLASLLAYYSYLIMGLDYDTYAKFGGNPYYQKAQNVLNLNQNANEKGWKSYEDQKNRYWLLENLMNKVYQPLRESYYLYHRKALDEFLGNEEMGRNTIIECLRKIQQVNTDKPGSVLIRMFFDSKAQELVNIFGKANPQDKQLVYNLLNNMDPANGPKYEKIMKN